MKQITIYSTPSCSYCNMAKAYFKDKQIEFEEVDLTAQPERIQEAIDKSGQMGVPVILINDGSKEDVMVGFDQKKLAELLAV